MRDKIQDSTRLSNLRAVEMTAEHFDSSPEGFVALARAATNLDHTHGIDSNLARSTYDRHRSKLRGNRFENLARCWTKSVGIYGLPAIAALYWDPKAHPHVLHDPVVSTVVLGRLAKASKAKTSLGVIAWLHGLSSGDRGVSMGTLGNFGPAGDPEARSNAMRIAAALGLPGEFPPVAYAQQNWILSRGVGRSKMEATEYKQGKSAGDGKCWSAEQGWQLSTDPKHPTGTIWRRRGLGAIKVIMFATADPNTYKDESGEEWSCTKGGGGDHPTLDPEKDALSKFPKFPVRYLQDGFENVLMFENASEVPRLHGHLVLTYRKIAVAWVSLLVKTADTPKKKAWAKRLVAELKSQSKSSCVSLPFMERCKRYLAHYWLIANASSYLCEHFGGKEKCKPPLIDSNTSIIEQWEKSVSELDLGGGLRKTVIVGGILLGGIVIISVAKRRK